MDYWSTLSLSQWVSLSLSQWDSLELDPPEGTSLVWYVSALGRYLPGNVIASRFIQGNAAAGISE